MASERGKGEDVEMIEGMIRAPSASREAIVDVISMRGLARAVSVLARKAGGSDDDVKRALAKTINLSGAMARVIEDGR